MTRNVSETELDALLARPEAPRLEVASRDFREPRWLAPEDLAGFRIPAAAAGTAVVEVFRSALPSDVELEETGVAEDGIASARERWDESVVLACESPVGPSIARMECSSALELAELALGGGGIDPLRPLTPFESGLVERILGSAFARVAQAFGSGAKDPRLVSDPAALDRMLPRDGDPRRIAVRIGIAVGGRTLGLHFLLAGIAAEARKPAASGPTRPAAPSAMPPRIASARVEVAAVLCELEIMLSDLLALEPGDLIPLTVTPGDPIEVRIEGEPCGRARFGASADRLAIRMTEVQKLPPTR